MKHFLSPTGQLFAYNPDGTQDHLIPEDYTPVAPENVAAERARIEREALDLLSFSERRAMAYPLISDQLDTIFHSGLEVWRAQIQAVKDQIPKE
jgi:hypothetical protein